jgi:hypothetical protein
MRGTLLYKFTIHYTHPWTQLTRRILFAVVLLLKKIEVVLLVIIQALFDTVAAAADKQESDG